jgi:hypothetical protein
MAAREQHALGGGARGSDRPCLALLTAVIQEPCLPWVALQPAN